MADVKIIEINEDVMSLNDKTAEKLRNLLTSRGVYFINVMSAPGSGKTTLLTSLINRLKNRIHISEMDVDIASSLDAQRVADATGVRSIQIHNGGLCHIDADMTTRAIDEFGLDDTELLILENIGNLVCPAEFDTGAHLNMMLLSVPEGDDKPLKYPLMFCNSDIVVITKSDVAAYFNFDFVKARERIQNLNPNATILEVSAKTGEGMEQLEEILLKKIETGKRM